MHLWMKQSPCWDRTGSGVIEKFQCSLSRAMIINPAAVIGLINHSFLSIGWHLYLFYVSLDAQWQSEISNGGMWRQDTALNWRKIWFLYKLKCNRYLDFILDHRKWQHTQSGRETVVLLAVSGKHGVQIFSKELALINAKSLKFWDPSHQLC